jgi:hypothetical protein
VPALPVSTSSPRGHRATRHLIRAADSGRRRRRVHLAELPARHRQHRDRLPERRDRAARSPARGTHPRQRAPATPRPRGCRPGSPTRLRAGRRARGNVGGST